MPDAGDRERALRIRNRVASYGVQVRVMPGHDTRGGTFLVVPTKVFDHHDASSRKSGEWGALGLILDGTPRGIPGPLSNAQVARCLDNVPKIAWVADGTCSHAGIGGPREDIPANDANRRTYGVEKANDGIGEPYTAAAMYATRALFHAMAVESGEIPASFPMGHKEWTTRKSDPQYDMNALRQSVGAFKPTTIEEDFMATMTDGEKAELLTLARNFQNGVGGVRSAGAGWLMLNNTLLKVTALETALRELAAAPGSASVDVDGLMAKIEASIEGVTVKLQVPDDEPPVH